MASRTKLQKLERRIVIAITAATFMAVLAAFSGALMAHRNTMAIVDPIVRWLWPAASADDIARIHNAGRKLGHFLIPAAAFGLLVIGPLRRRPLIALILCALFAGIDEWFQTFTPGRNGSLLDVALDTSGALFAFFAYSAIARWPRTRRTRPAPLKPMRG